MSILFDLPYIEGRFARSANQTTLDVQACSETFYHHRLPNLNPCEEQACAVWRSIPSQYPESCGWFPTIGPFSLA